MPFEALLKSPSQKSEFFRTHIARGTTQAHLETRTTTTRFDRVDTPPMPRNNFLYQMQAEPRALAAWPHAVERLKDAQPFLRRYTRPLVADSEASIDNIHRDQSTPAAVSNGVLDQVGQDTRKRQPVANDRHRRFGRIQRELVTGIHDQRRHV